MGLADLIQAEKFNEARNFILKNFDSDKKPFRNINYLQDHLTDDLRRKASIELKLYAPFNMFWFCIMVILTIIQLFLWISPELSGHPWSLILWITGSILFGYSLLDRKSKLHIDGEFFILQHKEDYQVRLNNILTGFVHEASNSDRNLFSKPKYYLTLFTKDSYHPILLNISGLELNGWRIGALLGYRIPIKNPTT